MNIRFQGSLTKDEFKNSIKLANRPVLKTSGIHFELWVILLIAGIAMILIGLRMLFLAINLSGGTLVAVIGAVLIGYAMKVRSGVDRAWESVPREQLQREASITGEHLELRAHTETSQLYWTGFTGYGEYENIVSCSRAQSPIHSRCASFRVMQNGMNLNASSPESFL